MNLRQLLTETNDPHQDTKDGGVRVFKAQLDWRYWRLDDYVVSSAISGPSFVLVPRTGETKPTEGA